MKTNDDAYAGAKPGHLPLPIGIQAELPFTEEIAPPDTPPAQSAGEAPAAPPAPAAVPAPETAPANPEPAGETAAVRYYFRGEPAEYAAFFGPRAPLPHLVTGEGPVFPGFTPAACTAFEPYTGPTTAGLPFLLAPLSGDEIADMKRFEAELRQVEIADRSERAFTCSIAMTQWRAHMNVAGLVELLGLIALERFIIDNLWREISVSVCGAPPVPLFKSVHDFIARVIRPFMPPEKAKRLSHKRRAIRLWLKLRERGYPVPPNVDRLEDLSLLANAIELYAAIVAHNRGGLPQAGQIEAVLKGGTKALTKPKGSLAQTQKAQVLEAIAKLGSYTATLEDPVLDGLVADVEKAAKGNKVVKQKLTRLKPRLAPELGCPFHFEEVDHTLTVTVDPLPDPMPYRALKAIPKRATWSILELPDQRLRVVVELDHNPAKARHQRAEAYHWASEICAELQCPLPAVAAA